jgi:AraC-like DNA-binding protein
MIQYLVTKEHPVKILHSVMREFEQEEMAINCGQILMCDGGSATLYINYVCTEMHPGSIVVMKPFDVVRGENASDDYRVLCLAYDGDIMRDASFRIESLVHDYLNRGFTTTDELTGECLHHIISVIEPMLTEVSPSCLRDVAAMQLRSFFLVCYERCINNPNLDMRRRHKDDLFSDFFNLLIVNHRQERNVGYYANLLNMTPRYLNEVVNYATGKSAKTVIDEYVTIQLKMTLQLSTKSITEIAWDYNFESLPFFCDYFKKRVGVTPQTFRNG